MLARPVWLAGLALLGSAAADRCAVSTLVVHCETHCSGINSTSFATTAAPAEVMLPPADAVGMLTELEDETRGRRGGHPLMFAQLAETKPTAGAVVAAPAHELMSPDQLISLLGPVEKLEWKSVRASYLGCVDGRHSSSGLYAYGGDFGELLLALTVYEHMSQRQLSQVETTSLFNGWLARLAREGGSFAMCTNSATVSTLTGAVGAAAVDLSSPSEALRPSLMLRLVAPEFVGSEHVKWMLQRPDQYSVRKPLVEQLIRSFFGVLWNEYHPHTSSVRLEVLEGSHAERALVKLHSSRWCWAEQGLAPAVTTKARSSAVFVHSSDAVLARRADIVTFLSTHVAVAVEPFEMRARIAALGDGQAKLTEKAMAGLLRTYSVLVK